MIDLSIFVPFANKWVKDIQMSGLLSVKGINIHYRRTSAH